MYCPNCATTLSDDQKFCRTCGLDLQVISQILDSDSQALQVESSVAEVSKTARKRKAKWHRTGLFTVLLSLLVGCLIPISLGLLPNYEGLNQLILVLAGICGLLLFLGSILIIYSETLSETHDEASQWMRPRQKARTKKLPPTDRSESIPSVTESTTDLLEVTRIKVPRERA